MTNEESKLPGREFRVRLFGQVAVDKAMSGATASLAPWITEITDQALFGEVWQRDGLALRDRSLVTIIALASTGRTHELKAHIRAGLSLGITQEEIVESFGQLLFYASLPVAHAALAVAREVFEDSHEMD